jgi:hypothetical protein
MKAMSPFEWVARLAIGKANSLLASYEEQLEKSSRQDIR